MDTIQSKIINAIVVASQVTLLARAICWEAPPWAESDQPYVAAVIQTRRLQRDVTVSEVLFAEGQFSTVSLLDQDPPGMEQCLEVAAEAYFWTWEELPVAADHFWSPVYMTDPPYWAAQECEVKAEGAVQKYYFLEGCN